jgi:hypothetical protein
MFAQFYHFLIQNKPENRCIVESKRNKSSITTNP